MDTRRWRERTGFAGSLCDNIDSSPQPYIISSVTLGKSVTASLSRVPCKLSHVIMVQEHGSHYSLRRGHSGRDPKEQHQEGTQVRAEDTEDKVSRKKRWLEQRPGGQGRDSREFKGPSLGSQEKGALYS